MARETQSTSISIYLKNCDVISSLVAAEKELTSGIEIETAWIIASCPLLTDIVQRSIGTYPKNSDTVVQPVACIDKSTIGRNHDTRTEITSGKARW